MKRVPLGDIATIDRKSIRPADIQTGTTYVGLENIEAGGAFVGVSMVANGDLASSKFAFKDDHILFGKLRPYLAKIALPTFGGICSTDILPIRVAPGGDRRFVAHYLRRQRVVDEVNGLATGANLPRISPKALETVLVPWPELDEQRRIADILDRADALRTKRREASAHLDALGQSIFYEMFGGSQDWPVSKLESLAMPEKGSIRTGPFGSQLLTSEFTPSGVAVLGIDNTAGNTFSWKERRYISEEKYRQLKRYTVHPGDLIITIMGTLGRCAVVPEDVPRVINTKHLCCITLDRRQADPAYVHAYFLHHSTAARHLRQTTKGSIMAGLNMGIIKAMPVLVPPVELQQEFANRAAAVECLKATHRAQLAELDNLFLSLEDRAFKGGL